MFFAFSAARIFVASSIAASRSAIALVTSKIYSARRAAKDASWLILA